MGSIRQTSLQERERASLRHRRVNSEPEAQKERREISRRGSFSQDEPTDDDENRSFRNEVWSVRKFWTKEHRRFTELIVDLRRNVLRHVHEHPVKIRSVSFDEKKSSFLRNFFVYDQRLHRISYLIIITLRTHTMDDRSSAVDTVRIRKDRSMFYHHSLSPRAWHAASLTAIILARASPFLSANSSQCGHGELMSSPSSQLRGPL